MQTPIQANSFRKKPFKETETRGSEMSRSLKDILEKVYRQEQRVPMEQAIGKNVLKQQKRGSKDSRKLAEQGKKDQKQEKSLKIREKINQIRNVLRNLKKTQQNIVKNIQDQTSFFSTDVLFFKNSFEKIQKQIQDNQKQTLNRCKYWQEKFHLKDKQLTQTRQKYHELYSLKKTSSEEEFDEKSNIIKKLRLDIESLYTIIKEKDKKISKLHQQNIQLKEVIKKQDQNLVDTPVKQISSDKQAENEQLLAMRLTYSTKIQSLERQMQKYLKERALFQDQLKQESLKMKMREEKMSKKEEQYQQKLNIFYESIQEMREEQLKLKNKQVHMSAIEEENEKLMEQISYLRKLSQNQAQSSRKKNYQWDAMKKSSKHQRLKSHSLEKAQKKAGMKLTSYSPRSCLIPQQNQTVLIQKKNKMAKNDRFSTAKRKSVIKNILSEEKITGIEKRLQRIKFELKKEINLMI